MLEQFESTFDKRKQPPCMGGSISTCYTERTPQALSALLVVCLLQVHPAHSHYLTDEVNLVPAQVLVPQVLVDAKQRKPNN